MNKPPTALGLIHSLLFLSYCNATKWEKVKVFTSVCYKSSLENNPKIPSYGLLNEASFITSGDENKVISRKADLK